MGWTPADVRAASLADFSAAVDGWLRAQGVGDDDALDPDDVAAIQYLLNEDDPP